ncbi:MAG: ComEC family competence protein, partial [Proteobacteria bacterium]|nr:ComEC family competence protein [Pseudomonadota bacterium]
MADENRQGRGRGGARAIHLPVRHGLPEGWRGQAIPFLEHRWHRFQALVALELEHRTPFLWLPVAFGLGILVYFAVPQEPLWWHGLLLALVATLPATLDTGLRRALGITLLMAALGFSAATWRTLRVNTPMLPRDMITEVRGFVETLDPGQGRMRLTLRPLAIADVPPAALPKAVRIGAPAASEVAPGDFVVLRARLSPPSEASMPGGYDFRRDAFFKSIGAVGYALGKPSVTTPPEPPPRDLTFNAWVDSGRNWLTARIANTIGGQAGALSAALITGKRGLISEATNDDLRASGLYHIVSISGIHMVLAAGVLFWSVRAFLAALPGLALGWPIKKIAALFAMAGSTFYCVFSGSEVATERSLIMTLVMLGAILADRPALAMRNLAISALLVLAREPESLVGPSFQMSFAAVACLIGANRMWQNWRRNHPPREWGPLVRILRSGLFLLLGIGATTLVATLATGPFSVFHFHRINPFGLIGNALALPLVSLVVMPAAVIGTLLSPLDLDWIVWRIMGEGVSGVLFVAERVGAMENASYAVARLSFVGFGLMVLSLLLFANLQSKLRALSLAPLAALPFVPLHPPVPDMVIDSIGKSALVRTQEGRFHLLAPEAANRFTLAQWLPALGDNRSLRDK